MFSELRVFMYKSRYLDDITWTDIKWFRHLHSHLVTAVNQRFSAYCWLPYLVQQPTLSLARALQKTADFLSFPSWLRFEVLWKPFVGKLTLVYKIVDTVQYLQGFL